MQLQAGQPQLPLHAASQFIFVDQSNPSSKPEQRVTKSHTRSVRWADRDHVFVTDYVERYFGCISDWLAYMAEAHRKQLAPWWRTDSAPHSTRTQGLSHIEVGLMEQLKQCTQQTHTYKAHMDALQSHMQNQEQFRFNQEIEWQSRLQHQNETNARMQIKLTAAERQLQELSGPTGTGLMVNAHEVTQMQSGSYTLIRHNATTKRGQMYLVQNQGADGHNSVVGEMNLHSSEVLDPAALGTTTYKTPHIWTMQDVHLYHAPPKCTLSNGANSFVTLNTTCCPQLPKMKAAPSKTSTNSDTGASVHQGASVIYTTKKR